MNKLKQTLEKILKKENEFLDAETGEINYIKVKDFADKIDEKLIALLAGNKELKKKFFTKIKDVYVFNINDFKFFLDESKIDNSYTKYANKIGLSDGDELIENRNGVALDFPFKDCVLEGGQSAEEGTDTYFEYGEKKTKTVKGKKVTEPAGYKEKQAKRKEVFFNQVLAHDEIDRLFDKKALVNWKRFTKDSGKNGEKVKEIKRDENGTIKENLIIKGNNLLALHSLKSEFAGKIKLIYIDPPYYFENNKKEDSFIYNSNFKLSTWLTFMKNRLEIAKELLTDDGAIFVQISDDGFAELHLLLKNIFGRNNFINKITVRTKSPSGFASVNAGVFETAEYILAFGKEKTKWTYNTQYIESGYDRNYKWFIENKDEDFSKWKIKDLFEYVAQKEGYKSKKEAINKLQDDVFYKKVSDFATANKNGIFRYTAIGKNASNEVVKTSNSSKKSKNKIFKIERDKHYDVYILNGQELAFYSKKVRNIDGKDVPSIQLSNMWVDTPYEGIANEGGVTLKGGKKPEKLIRRIIDMSTCDGDIILDFFGGSGTTGAVAHKMNRQYILTEQMDYIHDLPEARLREVINGDQTGISKAVNWKDGGDFVYFELAKWNEQAKEEINEAKDLSELVKLLDTLYEKYFLNYNVRIKDFKEKIVKEENFKKLSLKEQKRMFLTMLDLNQMYVQESEMTDKRFGINKEDQKLTKEFYKK